MEHAQQTFARSLVAQGIDVGLVGLVGGLAG